MKPIIIPKPFKALFNDSITEIIEDSGRSSGKTTTNESLIAVTTMSGSDNHVWYTCANESDIKKTIKASLQSSLEEMGIAEHYRYKESEKALYCDSGSIIYFGGINGKTVEDTTRTKGFTPKGKTLALAICDEANKANSNLHLDGFATTANKFLKDNGKMIWAFNPHPNKTHWSHAYFKDKIRSGAYKLYSTYKDIRQLLKTATINEIERAELSDPLFYRFWYLGESVNFAGMVYPQFNPEIHCINVFDFIFRGDRFSELIIGVDEGTVNDSTCCTALAVMMSGKAVVLDCLEISPKREGQLSPSEMSRKVIEWFNAFKKKFIGIPQVPRFWTFESAEGGQALMRQFRADSGEPCGIVRNKSVWGDIKRVRSMLAEGILFFHMAGNVTTNVLTTDIEGYIIDPKTNDLKKDQREDTIDSLEYATKLYYDRPLKTAR